MSKLANGGVYQDRYRLFVLVFIWPGKWGMLSIERHRTKGMSSPIFQHDGGKYVFSEEELKEKFDCQNWKRLDGRLRIEKIDELSFVEYTNGDLERWEGDAGA